MEYLNLTLKSHLRRFWMAKDIKEIPIADPSVIQAFAEMLPKKDTDHSWLVYEHVASLVIPHIQNFMKNPEFDSTLVYKNREVLDSILQSAWSTCIKKLWKKSVFWIHEAGLKTYLVERYSILHPEWSNLINISNQRLPKKPDRATVEVEYDNI